MIESKKKWMSMTVLPGCLCTTAVRYSLAIFLERIVQYNIDIVLHCENLKGADP